ncbi:MAG: AraC family transcriptional regulator [Eubacteriales bacterium]|nr:AraC family transcriptional regulator [Eubacteriales bacterium]
MQKRAAAAAPPVRRANESLAESICRYLMEHMDRHITIQQLSELFHVSQTQLKNSFKKTYGTSVYAYIRTEKMWAAARMLRETNETVLEVAGQFGYNNGSKFAKAFSDVMGMTPKEYRNTEKVHINNEKEG